jgi:hypothetical protein
VPVDAVGLPGKPAFIHRSSWRSVTFLCPQCELKWTITWANLHKVAAAKAKRTLAENGVPLWIVARRSESYTAVAQLTAAAAAHEGRRLNTIRRQVARKPPG